VFVDPSVRGGGVGESLVRAAVERLGARGAPRILLLSASANTRAQSVFERAGFRRTMVEMTCEYPAPPPVRPPSMLPPPPRR